MKKFLLSLLAAGAVLTAAAQAPSMSPRPGRVITQGDDTAGANIAQGGLGSILFNVNATINRDCTGVAVLYKDGKQAVSVPASNTKRVYCEEGFTSHLDKGAVRIMFWTGNNKDNPYKLNGTYKIVIPSDFYRVNGVGNKPFTAEFYIDDNEVAAYTLKVNPAEGNVETLSTVTLDFEGATSISAPGEELIYFYDPYKVTETKDEEGNTIKVYNTKVYPSVKVEGTKLILTLPEAWEKAGKTSLNFESPVSIVTSNGTESYDATIAYTITGKPEVAVNPEGYKFTPEPGTWEGGIPAFKCTDEWSLSLYNNSEAYANIRLTLPEGATFKSVTGMMTTSRLYIIDANGEKISANIKYTQSKDKHSIFFGNGAYVNGAAAYTQDIPWGLNPGTYYFVIPAGAFTYTLGESTISCPELKWGPFTITAAAAKYTVAPENGSKVEDFKTITVTFDEGAKVAFTDAYTTTAVVKNGTIVYDVEGVIADNVVTFTNASAFNIPGTYDVEFPPFLINGTRVVLDNVTYTVEPKYIPSMTIENDGSLIELTPNEEGNGFYGSVTIPTGQAMEVQFDLPVGYDALYYLSYNIGGTSTRATDLAELTEGGFQLAVDNKIPVVAGENNFMVTYAVGNEATTPTGLTLLVSVPTGVEAIEGVETEAEYFTLQGVKVANPENGLYIKVVNGKATKVLVK
ncbi:MAG: hypothetical protein NC036_00455 [Muribaculaceae bacterium]|nr:hypothetical protein [Muribaculaceae bacterium]